MAKVATIEFLLPPVNNPVAAAHYVLASEYIKNKDLFWPTSLRDFVAGLPTCDAPLANVLVASTGTLTREQLAEAAAILSKFTRAFANVTPLAPKHKLELTDEILRLPTLDICMHIRANGGLTIFPRTIRMFLANLPSMDTDLRRMLDLVVTLSNVNISDADVARINAGVERYIENAAEYIDYDTRHKIAHDHRHGTSVILAPEKLADKCRLMYKSEFMRRSNLMWPRVLRNWAVELPGLSIFTQTWLADMRPEMKYLAFDQRAEIAACLRTVIEADSSYQ